MSVQNLQRQKKDSLIDFTAGRNDAPPAPKSCHNNTEWFLKCRKPEYTTAKHALRFQHGLEK
jgi:hypothetical protein